MSRTANIKRYLRYDWPLHAVMLLSAWLPDNVVFLRLRGFLARPFFGNCGPNLLLGRGVYFYQPSRIHLGKNVYLAYGSVLIANSEIILEDEVMIAPYAVLSSGDHLRKRGSFRQGPVYAEPIRIGWGTWVGTHSSVLNGAVIEAGCIVAANACVTRGIIPRDSLAAGVPAKVIKKLTDSNREETQL